MTTDLNASRLMCAAPKFVTDYVDVTQSRKSTHQASNSHSNSAFNTQLSATKRATLLSPLVLAACGGSDGEGSSQPETRDPNESDNFLSAISTISSAPQVRLLSTINQENQYPWRYDDLMVDIVGDGLKDIVMLTNVITNGAREDESLTIIDIIFRGDGSETHEMASFEFEGFTRRVFSADLNGDGREDLILFQNLEDGRIGEIDGVETRKFNHLLLLSQEDGTFSEARFGDPLWYHMAALVPDQSEQSFRLLAGAFDLEKPYTWFDFNLSDEVFVEGEIAFPENVLAGTSSYFYNGFIFGNSPYPHFDLIRVDAYTLDAEVLFSRGGEFADYNVLLSGWGQAEGGTVLPTRLRNEDGNVFLEMGLGHIRNGSSQKNGDILVATDDRTIGRLVRPGEDVYVLDPFQSILIIDPNTGRLLQEIRDLSTTITEHNYINQFHLVDMTADGSDEIVIDRDNVFWSAFGEFHFWSDYNYLGDLIGGMYVDGSFNRKLLDIAFFRLDNDEILLGLVTNSVHTNGIDYHPNPGNQQLGIDPNFGEIGVLYSGNASISLLDVLAHEASKNGIELVQAGLSSDGSVYAVDEENLYYFLSPNEFGVLLFSDMAV